MELPNEDFGVMTVGSSQHRQHTGSLHESAFEYMRPTPDQMTRMSIVRSAAKAYADILDEHIPAGPDKTYLMRMLRDVGMWANVAITRHPDGTPRA